MNFLLLIIILSLTTGLIFWFIEKRTLYTGILFAIGIFCTSILFLDLFYKSNSIFKLISIIIFYILLPLSLLTAVFLLIFNWKVLVTREGNRFANKLSLLFGIYIFLLLSLIITYLLYETELNTMVLILLSEAILHGIYFGTLFFIYLIYSYIYQKLPIKTSVNYIIVLGCGLNGEKITPLLKSRLDKAIEIYNNKIIENNDIKIIVSGGKGSDELVSEASAMGNYLLSQNIKNDAIILEDKSTNTYENILFSKNIIEMTNKSSNVNTIVVTNNFHVFRASVYSRRAKLKAQGIGSPTAFFFLPNALIREFIAILLLYKWLNIAVILFFISMAIITLLPF